MYDKYEVRYRALSPITHGGESSGTMTPLNKIRMTIQEGDEEFEDDIPAVTGNSFRGVLRRRLGYDLLSRLDIEVGDRTSNLLYSGGNFEGAAGKIDRRLIEEAREMLPMLSLIATSFPSQPMEGKLNVGFLYPVCYETERYTGVESDKSVYEYVDTLGYTRIDDLRAGMSPEAKEHVRDHQPDEGDGTSQMMRYHVRFLAPGTPFHQKLTLKHPDEMERATLGHAFDLFEQNPVIGGKSSVGHGKVSLSFEGERPDGGQYVDYIEDNKDDVREYIKKLDDRLS